MPSRKRQNRRGRYHATSDLSPLDEFFARYDPRFKYDSTESASHEFYRLCDEFDWDRDHHEKEEAHQGFKDALVQQFNKVYGTNEDDLGNWQNLCYITHIKPIPEGLNACREASTLSSLSFAVRGTFVNLVDLVDTDTTGEDLRVFDSERELSEYTRNTGKFFPKESAYAGGLLRYLLRHILHPAAEVTSRRRIKRRR
ncbi:hypothetical protein J3R83DRAFT_5345 [Lanmaoa asiatica]|nr:hypothetical protein J3R83DRAFT_5345 [Lanmaoa asiatica]